MKEVSPFILNFCRPLWIVNGILLTAVKGEQLVLCQFVNAALRKQITEQQL